MQERAGIQIQGLQLMLGKVADGQMLATGTITRHQRALTPECIHQGRLARTIGTQQPDPAARQQGQVNAVEDCSTAVPGLAIAYRQQRIGNLLGHRKLEAERRIDMGRGNALHPLQSLDAALGLTGLRGLGLEPIDEPLDFGDPGLLAFKTGLLLGQTLTALALKG